MSLQSDYKNNTLLSFLDKLSVDLPLIPAWLLWTYIGVVCGGGCLSNAILAGYLSKTRKLPANLHLALTDIATLMFLAPYEIIILSEATGVWTFPDSYCPIFLGTEVLLGTATIYILVVIHFSTISEKDTSITIPLIVVWLLSMSLSTPEFILSEISTPRPEYHICSLPRKAAFLISAFRVGLPVFLLISGLIFTILRLCDPPSDRPLSLSITLSTTYLLFSLQRSVLAVCYGLIKPLSGPDAFRTPPIANVAYSPIITLVLSLVHYSLSALRPFLTWVVSCNSNKQNNQLV